MNESVPPSIPAPPPCADEPVSSHRRNELGTLLKDPAWLVGQIAEDDQLAGRAIRLAFWGLVFHAVFGFAFGLFGGWSVALMAAVKTPLIATCAMLLCFPSLYVFACVGGMPLSLSQAATLAGAVLAVTGLLLLALAPVAWLFSVSTVNAGFIVVLILIIWIIAIGFARGFWGRFRACATLSRLGGLNWWMMIYLLVTWQMTTFMRPLLVPANEGWFTGEKMFFLIHLGRTIAGE